MAPKLALFDSVAQHDEGVNAPAEHRAWLRHDRDLDDGWMFEQNVLDLGSVDLEPAAVDHILDAIDDPQVALLIHDPEIAGLPISGDELALGGLRVVEIARRDHGAANIDFARLPMRSLNALSVHHQNVAAGHGEADRFLSRNRLLWRHDRRGRGGFGRAVAVQEFQFWQLLGDALERGLRHDRPAIARDAPMEEIRRFEIRREQT
jgi:hypothetical protein